MGKFIKVLAVMLVFVGGVWAIDLRADSITIRDTVDLRLLATLVNNGTTDFSGKVITFFL